MKRRWFLSCAALLILVMAACSAVHSPNNTQSLQLYFLSTDENGPAIVGQSSPDVEATPESLLQALLAGPENDALRSPFPQGLSLRGFKLNEGRLIVDFSEQYGGLTEVSLTLADYCVVLTLCQLEEVTSVEITVSGRPLPYRSHQTLTLDDAILATQ